MKRSEMVHRLYMWFPYESSIDKEGCDALLDLIESFGMTPPQYNAVLATGKKYNKDTDQGRDTFLAKGWEPEDD